MGTTIGFKTAAYIAAYAADYDARLTAEAFVDGYGEESETVRALLKKEKAEDFLSSLSSSSVTPEHAEELKSIHALRKKGVCPADLMKEAYDTGLECFMKEADTQMVLGYDMYVWDIIHAFFSGNIARFGEEMLQDGRMGVQQAFHTWDPAKSDFVTYAKFLVKGAISKDLKSYANISTYHMENVKKILSARRECEAKGIDPSPTAISAITGLRLEQVVEETEAYDARFQMELLDNTDQEDAPFIDPEEEAEKAEREALIQSSLKAALAELPPDLLEVVRLKFFTPVETFVEAGAKKKAFTGEPGREREATISDMTIASYLGESYDVVHGRLERALTAIKISPSMKAARDMLCHDAQKKLEADMQSDYILVLRENEQRHKEYDASDSLLKSDFYIKDDTPYDWGSISGGSLLPDYFQVDDGISGKKETEESQTLIEAFSDPCQEEIVVKVEGAFDWASETKTDSTGQFVLLEFYDALESARKHRRRPGESRPRHNRVG